MFLEPLERRLDRLSCGGLLASSIRRRDTLDSSGNELANRNGHANHLARSVRRNQRQNADGLRQRTLNLAHAAYDWRWLLEREANPFEGAVTFLGDQRGPTDRRDKETARESLHVSHYDAQARWLVGAEAGQGAGLRRQAVHVRITPAEFKQIDSPGTFAARRRAFARRLGSRAFGRQAGPDDCPTFGPPLTGETEVRKPDGQPALRHPLVARPAPRLGPYPCQRVPGELSAATLGGRCGVLPRPARHPRGAVPRALRLFAGSNLGDSEFHGARVLGVRARWSEPRAIGSIGASTCNPWAESRRGTCASSIHSGDW